jgi:hypothetical protein
MGLINNSMSGGRSIGAGFLNPRTGRGSTNQVASYWAGGGLSFNIATGGNTLTNYTAGGIQYRSHVFTASGTFALTALGSEPLVDILVVGGGGGGGGTPIGRGFGDGGGGAGGMATTTMLLPVGSYQVTIGGAGSATGCAGTGNTGGQSSFGVSTSLITANGGAGGGGCEFCCGGGGAGGSASVSGALGTSNVTTTGYNGNGGCSCGAGAQSGRDNTFQDGTTRKYASIRASSSYEGGCPCSQAGEVAGGGGGGGHTNCGCGAGGAAGVVIVRYKFVP